MMKTVLLALSASLLALPAAPATAQIMDNAGRPLQPEEARRLAVRIKSLQRTTGLQAATIAGIAERLGLAYSGLSEGELFRRLEAQVQGAVALQKRIQDLEGKISRLEDTALRDPAQALVTDAKLAFDEGRLEDAEYALGELAFLRESESNDTLDAWLDAVKSQAEAAQLQGTREASNRAARIRREAREITARRRENLEREEFKLALAEAKGRAYDARTFGWTDVLLQAIELFEGEVVPLGDRIDDVKAKGDAYHALGFALSDFADLVGGEEGRRYEAEAVEAYKKALRYYSRQASPDEWAGAQVNLGNSLRSLADGASGISEEELLEPYRKALEVYTSQERPELWSTVKINIAELTRSKGEDIDGADGLALISSAQDIYPEILAVLDCEEFGELCSAAQINSTNALVSHAEKSGHNKEAVYRQAIKNYIAAYSSISRDSHPWLWANLERGRAALMIKLGKLTGGQEGVTLHQDAITSLIEISQYNRDEKQWLDWANSQSALGDAITSLSKWAEEDDAIRLLQKALEGHEAALGYYEHVSSPYGIAMANVGLAQTRTALGLRLGGDEGNQMVEKAIDNFLAALPYFETQESVKAPTEIKLAIGIAYADMSAMKSTSLCPRLSDAKDWVGETITVYTSAKFPRDNDRAMRVMAHIEAELAEHCGED